MLTFEAIILSPKRATGKINHSIKKGERASGGKKSFPNDSEFPRGEIMPQDDGNGNYLIAMKRQRATPMSSDRTCNVGV